ncbi:MAG TPA: cupredoxin family copper-binding protein [Caulobacteraceae bacterium]|jgi:plastocyanin|nr:cupredoxin family copper-binding protein [Caulobacteraceae bacterium]
MRLKMTRRALAATGLAALVLGGGALVVEAATAASDAMVTIQNFDFHPMALTVPVGSSVTWKNLDGEPHTVTSTDGSFRSEALDQGDTYHVKFSKPGTYKYICAIHPRMLASVIVK